MARFVHNQIFRRKTDQRTPFEGQHYGFVQRPQHGPHLRRTLYSPPKEPTASEPSDNHTVMLERWKMGDEDVGGELLRLVYDDLHRIARGYVTRERAHHTLQPTASSTKPGSA